MIPTRLRLAVACCLVAPALPWVATGAHEAKAPESLPRIAEMIRGMTAHDGLFRFHVDPLGGRIWLELSPPQGPAGTVAEFLYVDSLRTGLGSNPVGLDRGQLGPTRWVALRRVGPRVLLEQLNPAFRADSKEASERVAARESFATSVLWGAEIAALDPDGRSLVDLTTFLVRDAHNVRARLEAASQGAFELDPERSAVELEDFRAFPDNVEFEALLTYAGREPGPHVRSTAPSPEAVTLSQHHSWIRLPHDGYRPRRFDPRAGSYAETFRDYAADLDEPLVRRWIARHRLEKRDPSADRSPVVKPIVFYVDRGAPEPVRSALVEGASWWAEAFAQAGFVDAFRVELLPKGVHPLDVRYNVIEWVHRSTRGWSYGGGIIDPRTGEIVNGHVLLGSLRVRQDRLLFEGLAGTERTGSGRPDDPVQLALARIRQLAAHEVGHALGLTHNFAASTYGGRASVMDYPAPLIEFDARGELDFSRAYGVGVGSWDEHAIRYAYAHFATGADEGSELERIVREGLEAGLLFLTDADARPAGAADPRANLWDNGDDPVSALDLAMRVRRQALKGFGERNVLPGTPLAHLEEVLAPVYFHHRYQLEAALKVVGGMEYHYALRGDGQLPTRIVDAARQRRALDGVLQVIDADALDLPDELLDLLAPRPHGEGRNHEMFPSETAPAFDLQAAAAAAVAAVVDGLLQPERLGRIDEFHRRDASMPGPQEVLERLTDHVFRPAPAARRQAEIQRLFQSVVIDRLARSLADTSLRPRLRSIVELSLGRVRDGLADLDEADPDAAAHAAHLTRWIERTLDDPQRETAPGWNPPALPPGSPIGGTLAASCGRVPTEHGAP